MISRGGLIVDGISFGKAVYKNNTGDILEEKAWLYKGEDETVKQAAFVMAVTKTPAVYLMDNTAIKAGTQTVSGTVMPVTETVHISILAGKATPDLLKETEVAAVQPDDEGNWTCEVTLEEVSYLYAWISPPIALETVTEADISITDGDGSGEESGGEGGGESGGESGDMPEEPKTHTITTEFTATPEIVNNQTAYSFSANLTGPADLSNATILALRGDTGEYEELENLTFTGSGGEYIAQANGVWSGTPYTSFRAEGETDDENGVISVEVTRYEATCLSGDTLITLSDGSEKRLDDLTENDVVMGGDMKPAKILRLARGHWNTYHILYRFDDGTTVDEVHEHRFFNIDQGFWQKLKNWNIGDRSRRVDGGETALVAVERIEESKEMFGLWVERNGYWANGLLSGDAEANLALLADATAEKAVDMVESLSERQIADLLRKEPEM